MDPQQPPRVLAGMPPQLQMSSGMQFAPQVPIGLAGIGVPPPLSMAVMGMPPDATMTNLMMAAHPGMPMQQPKFEPHAENALTMKPASNLVMGWLLENYESEEGSSLPRSTLYTHYLQFCQQTNLESVNAASFGKLIRSVFPNLKTRRLGTRGHSKYHYYGIRLKPTSKLRNLGGYTDAPLSNSAPVLQNPKREVTEEEEEEDEHSPQNSLAHSSATTTTSTTTTQPQSATSDQQVMGPGPFPTTARITSKQLPEFGMPERSKLPSTVRWDHVQTFALMYRTHCQYLLDTVAWHNFPEIENVLGHFWKGLPAHFKSLLVLDGLIDFLVERDALVYQSIEEILIPDVLGPMPLSLPPLIREFSRNFPEWLARAVDTLPAPLIQRKVAVATEFSVLLRKQATLNAMAASCRKVLSNIQHVTQMLQDWSRIDFHAIAHQSHWLCPAAHNISNSIQEDFRQFLQQRYGVEQWAHWLGDVLNRFLMKCTDVRQLTLTSQQVLLKWAFYSSLVIRDLTLRNAPSLGSFHLLRTLFEAYLGYLVDQRMQAHKTRMPYHPGGTSSMPPTPLSSFPTHSSADLVLNSSNSATAAAVSAAEAAETQENSTTSTSAESISPKAEAESPIEGESVSGRGTKHFLPFPQADSERPLKQARMDPPSSAEASAKQLLQPSGSSFSFASDRLPSLSGLVPPGGSFATPKSLPQAQGSFLLTPTEWAGVMPGGSLNFGSMGSMALPGNLVSPRKPSFGSFGSFSTEFRCLMRSSSFDRVRGSFERRESTNGAPPQSPSALDPDSPWHHLFYNLSTPNISFQSFAFPSQEDPSKQDSSGNGATSASSAALYSGSFSTSQTAASGFTAPHPSPSISVPSTTVTPPSPANTTTPPSIETSTPPASTTTTTAPPAEKQPETPSTPKDAPVKPSSEKTEPPAAEASSKPDVPSTATDTSASNASTTDNNSESKP